MRLACPNCGALYEIADAAIPRLGREVQCSACDHRWFHHPQATDPAHAGARQEPQGGTVTAAADPAAGDLAPEREDAGTETAPQFAPRPRPTDPAVLQILREEAAREMAARRRAAAEAEAGRGAAARPEPAADARPPRRALLPEIDEIDPSRRAPTGPEDAATIVHRAPSGSARGGFAVGLALSLTLAVLAAMAYVWSAELVAAVPALDDPLSRYVATVDAFHLTIRSVAR